MACAHTALAEYAEYQYPSIKQSAFLHLESQRVPPNDFYIYVAQSTGKKWKELYRYHNWYHGSPPIPVTPNGRTKNNGQIMTMGIGNLFAQVISGPRNTEIDLYCIAIEHAGMSRIWPRQTLWDRNNRLLDFPLKLQLSDQRAFELAEELHNRMAARATRL